MKSDIGMSESTRKGVANELAKLLANKYVLLIKTKNSHWNIEGPHACFQKVEKQVIASILALINELA